VSAAFARAKYGGRYQFDLNSFPQPLYGRLGANRLKSTAAPSSLPLKPSKVAGPQWKPRGGGTFRGFFYFEHVGYARPPFAAAVGHLRKLPGSRWTGVKQLATNRKPN
jgi:hypothetical protein